MAKHFQHYRVLQVIGLTLAGLGLPAQPVVQTFSYTGTVQTFTVPPCVNSMTIEAWGAQGGANWTSNDNFGGYAKAVFTVTQGTVLNIYVGAQPSGTVGGWNGGGNGETAGQGGGGASDVRIGGVTYADRVIVAGGGGGAGYWSSMHVVGGVGGGLVGGDGYRTTAGTPGGQGGTQTGSGLGTCVSTNNSAMAGGFGFGGSASGCGCEGYGGGGGWYGGAASGNCRGGGGGSGYISPNATAGTFSSGIRVGHGQVMLTYDFSGNLVSAVITPSAICSGQSATLSATGMLTYTWSAGSNPNSSSITVNPVTTTTYTVSGTNSLNCISQSAVTVSVNPTAPVLSITSSTTQTCPGKAVTLIASGALQYSWTAGVTNGVPFTPATTGTYVVTGVNGCGTSTADVVITVDPLPVSLAASSTLVCQLSPVTLTASGGTSYTWSASSQTVSTIVVNPSVNTVYTVTASDGTCQGVAMVTVNTNPNPTVTAATTDTRVCAGESVTLTATGADNYTWTPAVVTGSTGMIQPTQSLNYQVIGANGFGCTAQAIQFVIVDPLPDVYGTGSKFTVCTDGTVSLQASGTANTYSWSSGDASPGATVSVPHSTLYVVGGTLTATGCHNYDTVMVNVFQPTLTAGPSATVCRGAAVTITTGFATGHQWSDGSNGPWLVVQPENSSVITVTANITNTSIVCSATASVSIGVLPKPSITASADRQQMCNKETATLTATGADTYTWAGTFTGASYVYTANVPGTHMVNVIASNSVGCLDTAAVQMKVNTCSGLNEISGAESWMVYPNPSTGEFTVVGERETSLNVADALGRLVMKVTLNESNGYHSSLLLQTKGIYFVSDDRTGVKRKLVVTD